MKFLPKLLFVKDESFDYAEKIENLISEEIKNSLLINSKNLFIIKLKG